MKHVAQHQDTIISIQRHNRNANPVARHDQLDGPLHQTLHQWPAHQARHPFFPDK
jgi:hypothetical protein